MDCLSRIREVTALCNDDSASVDTAGNTPDPGSAGPRRRPLQKAANLNLRPRTGRNRSRPLVDGVLRWSRAVSRKWLARDVAALMTVATFAVFAAAALSTAPSDTQYSLQQSLTLLAAAGAGIAAIVLSFTARIDGDTAALRLASGLLVYGVVVLPVSAVHVQQAGSVWLLVGLLCCVATVVLFGAALGRRGDPSHAWPAAAVAVAASLFVSACAGMWPVLVPSAGLLTAASRSVLATWGIVAVLLVIRGVREQSTLLRRTGLGVLVIVGAHFGRMLGAGPAEPFLALSGLRLVGIVVVLAGVAPYAVRALAAQRDRDVAAATALAASLAAEQDAAVRTHEMRNAIVGLSGAAQLLSSGTVDREITVAMRQELDRLRELLERPPGTSRVVDAGGYAVRPVLRSLVMLHRSGGAEIELDVPAHLRAGGSGLALSQAAVNLLVNCARHAPGSPVRVRARTEHGRVRIEVTDAGPGLNPGVEVHALDQGWRRPGSEGSGLGLSISRQLIESQGGELWLEPNDGTSGCTAVISLPVATRPAGAAGIPAQGVPACVERGGR